MTYKRIYGGGKGMIAWSSPIPFLWGEASCPHFWFVIKAFLVKIYLLRAFFHEWCWKEVKSCDNNRRFFSWPIVLGCRYIQENNTLQTDTAYYRVLVYWLSRWVR